MNTSHRNSSPLKKGSDPLPTAHFPADCSVRERVRSLFQRPLIQRAVRTALAAALAGLAIGSNIALADPCGMVPPITAGDDAPIARVGEQQTYVFYKGGTETFVIHPGFTGKVDEFGMLIPFPSVPAIRKVPDAIFPHIEKAVDPPEVVVNLLIRRFRGRGGFAPGRNAAKKAAPMMLKADAVRVVKQEAVGMYEVTVLEAGSAKALQRWMDEHGYRYPDGMDKPCNEYVEAGWCFVAVKTKVASKENVDPRPGVRSVNAAKPAGSTFDGRVQAMGFRFKSERLVVPMRLSAFNKGELRNIVYVLTDEPVKIRSIPEEYVVRQLPGAQLYKNVVDPLPLRIIGGTEKDIPAYRRKSLPAERNPVPKNGAARDLFASDLLAVKAGVLSHPYEEKEKMLLRIGEALRLRGAEIDNLNEAALEAQRESIVQKSLAELKQDVTLTVVDGNFPREVLAGQNLAFTEYRMPARRNSPEFYDAKTKTPAAKQQGVLKFGKLSFVEPDLQEDRQDGEIRVQTLATAGMITSFVFIAGLGLFWTRNRPRG